MPAEFFLLLYQILFSRSIGTETFRPTITVEKIIPTKRKRALTGIIPLKGSVYSTTEGALRTRVYYNRKKLISSSSPSSSELSLS